MQTNLTMTERSLSLSLARYERGTARPQTGRWYRAMVTRLANAAQWHRSHGRLGMSTMCLDRARDCRALVRLARRAVV